MQKFEKSFSILKNNISTIGLFTFHFPTDQIRVYVARCLLDCSLWTDFQENNRMHWMKRKKKYMCQRLLIIITFSHAIYIHFKEQLCNIYRTGYKSRFYALFIFLVSFLFLLINEQMKKKRSTRQHNQHRQQC